jgi:hypothetical protein
MVPCFYNLFKKLLKCTNNVLEPCLWNSYYTLNVSSMKRTKKNKFKPLNLTIPLAWKENLKKSLGLYTNLNLLNIQNNDPFIAFPSIF